MREKQNSMAFLDIETTGLEPKRDRIIEIAVFVLKFDSKTHQGMASLVNPGVELPQFIVRYTGITQAMLSEAPGPEVLHEAFDLIADQTVAAYNVAFDTSFLVEEARRLGRSFNNDRLCVMELAQELNRPGFRGGFNL